MTRLSSPTILVIEDYPDAREMLSFMLRQKGFNVIGAENGMHGLLQARANRPDLIIMDLALPEMDGVETARRIHETPELSHVPIFVVSGFLTKDVAAQVREAGCDAMFNKPFDFESLLQAIVARLGLERSSSATGSC
jgi:CheY-like chemotaxis protein